MNETKEMTSLDASGSENGLTLSLESSHIVLQERVTRLGLHNLELRQVAFRMEMAQFFVRAEIIIHLQS